jgi:UDP-GlcNAc:undecaprenyl-phosphate GlcNAc-1-phosphate transferase
VAVVSSPGTDPRGRRPWGPGVVAAFSTAALTPLCARVARRLGIVDRPGFLKPQEREVPYLGGVAVTLGMAGVAVATGNARALAAPLVAVTVGLADDVRGLAPGLRLAAEAGAGLVAAGRRSGVQKVAAAAASMVLANAVNMVDGADGMAGAVTLASAAGFTALLRGPDRAMASALAGGAAGFLVFNRAPASIYLGDAGSYVIGTCSTQLLLRAWDEGIATGLGGCLLVGYPLTELVTTVLRRWRSGQPLMHGDRDHIYDRLMRSGWSATKTALTVGAFQSALGVAAVGMTRVRASWRRPPTPGRPGAARRHPGGL